MLFIGSCAGTFYALDKTTAKVKWSYNIRQDGDQNNFHGSALITDDLVITGTDGGSRPTGIGKVYAFDRTTGKVQWKYSAGRGVPTDIVRLNNNLYAVTFDDELICLDLKTGLLKWSFRTGNPNDQFFNNISPVVETNRVYFGGLDGKVYALESKSGKKLWEKDLGARISSSLVISGGSLYAGSANKRIHQLNAKNGAVISEFAPEEGIYWAFVLTQDSVITHLGEKTLASLPKSLEKPRWTQESAKPWSSSQPYVWRGTTIVGTEEGEVVAFRLSDGSRVWANKFTGPIGGIGGDDKILYIGTRRGTVYAYAPE